jgi:hypothetical protein
MFENCFTGFFYMLYKQMIFSLPNTGHKIKGLKATTDIQNPPG